MISKNRLRKNNKILNILINFNLNFQFRLKLKLNANFEFNCNIAILLNFTNSMQMQMQCSIILQHCNFGKYLINDKIYARQIINDQYLSSSFKNQFKNRFLVTADVRNVELSC